VTGRRFQREKLKYKLALISLSDLSLPPPDEPRGHPPEDEFDLTLISCPWRKRPDRKRRLLGIMTLLL
jgi:hypothetical protein